MADDWPAYFRLRYPMAYFQLRAETFSENIAMIKKGCFTGNKKIKEYWVAIIFVKSEYGG